jgi:hypothetical protein
VHKREKCKHCLRLAVATLVLHGSSTVVRAAACSALRVLQSASASTFSLTGRALRARSTKMADASAVRGGGPLLLACAACSRASALL